MAEREVLSREQQLRRLRITLPGRFEFDSNQTIMAMVADGHGWTITTPMNYVRARRFHKQISLIPFPAKEFARTLSVYTTELVAGPVVDTVANTIRQMVRTRAITPATERMTWLKDMFRLLPQNTD